jgi:hypothetical protein
MVSLLLFAMLFTSTAWAQDGDVKFITVTNNKGTGQEGLSFTATILGDYINIYWCRKDSYISHSVTCKESEIKDRVTISIADFKKSLGEGNELTEQLVEAIRTGDVFDHLYGPMKRRNFVKESILLTNPTKYFKNLWMAHYKNHKDKILVVGNCSISVRYQTDEWSVKTWHNTQRYSDSYFTLVINNSKEAKPVTIKDPEDSEYIQQNCFDHRSLEVKTKEVSISGTGETPKANLPSKNSKPKESIGGGGTRN